MAPPSREATLLRHSIVCEQIAVAMANCNLKRGWLGHVHGQKTILSIKYGILPMFLIYDENADIYEAFID